MHNLVSWSKRRQACSATQEVTSMLLTLNVRNKITEAITNLKTVRHRKPTAEKMSSYLKKGDGKLELVMLQSYLKINIYKPKGVMVTKLLPLQKNVTPPNAKQQSPSMYKQNIRWESAKCLTCSRANVPCVLTCSCLTVTVLEKRIKFRNTCKFLQRRFTTKSIIQLWTERHIKRSDEFGLFYKCVITEIRRLTRNFSRQGRFCGIKALQ